MDDFERYLLLDDYHGKLETQDDIKTFHHLCYEGSVNSPDHTQRQYSMAIQFGSSQ